MRRRLQIAAAVGLVLVVLLLLAGWYDRAPKGRSVVRGTLPGMTEHPDRPEGEPGELPAVPRSDDLATIVCRVEGTDTPGMLVASAESELVQSTVSADDLILRVEPGTWDLAWLVTVSRGGTDRNVSQPLGTWTLAAGDTRACVLGAEGVPIQGRVVDTDGHPVGGALVEGCESRLVAGEDGHFAGPLALTMEGTCALRARYLDGALSRYGDPVTVDLFTATQPIELVVPSEPVAGLGIGFRVERAGVRVTMVMPDSPAYAAGLEVNDLIIAVDGVSVVGLDTWEFLALGTGKEGSLVRLDLRYQDVVDHVEFRRERIAALE